MQCKSFPDCSVGKQSACNAGDPGSIPGSGRSPGEGIGHPLQYSWPSLVVQLVNEGDLSPVPGLERVPRKGKGYSFQYSGLEHPMDYSPWGLKNQTRLSDFHSLTHVERTICLLYLLAKHIPPHTHTESNFRTRRKRADKLDCFFLKTTRLFQVGEY